jgi:hypothetical protein
MFKVVLKKLIDTEKKIVHKDLQSLKYLKKANPLGYAYIIKADEIMG